MILGSSDSEEKVIAAIPPSYMIGSQDPTFSFSKSRQFVEPYRVI